jgi:phospholipid transport system substrate-binding protein
MAVAKYLLTILTATCLGTGIAHAQPYPPTLGDPHLRGLPGPGFPTERGTASPTNLLEQRIARLRSFLSGEAGSDPAQMRAFLMQEIAPVFDFEQMSRWILSDTYQQLSPPQRQQFQAELKKMFFGALGRLARPYAGQPPRVEILRPRPRGPNEVVISARVSQGQGYPVRVDFRFMQGPAGWKIYDVASNGSSAVVYYRNYFQSRLRRDGAGGLTGP